MKDLSNVCGVDLTKSKWRKKTTKGWQFILYPDSEYYNPNWENELTEYLNPCCWILHDKDIYDTDVYYSEDDEEGHKKGDIKYVAGEVKKPHYHVYFWFGNAVKFTQAVEVMESCGGCMIAPILNKVAAIRYLTHIDHPEKAQYDVKDVVIKNGLNFDKFYYDSDINIDQLRDEIIDWCNLNKIVTVNQFVDYARKHKREWWAIYANKAGVRNIVADYCKNQGYEERLYQNRPKPKAWKVPLYDSEGKVVTDEKGNIIADKQISSL